MALTKEVPSFSVLIFAQDPSVNFHYMKVPKKVFSVANREPNFCYIRA